VNFLFYFLILFLDLIVRSGLSAAIEAARLGANVLVLEKTRAVGGNSAKASSGINGAASEVQMAQHIEDSPELFVRDTESAGKSIGDHSLVNRLAQESAEAIAFLIDLNLPLQELIQLGGHSVKRTHRLASHAPIGMSMIKALNQKISNLTNVQVETNATVQEVLYEDRSGGRRVVTGVRYRNSAGVDVEVVARTVVLASGGMAYDQSAEGLLAQHAPAVLGLATSSGPQADGAGMKIAAKVHIYLHACTAVTR
jgi:succinate dehydrogenase/fumarate reductase flavoprotein subunit